MIRFIAVSRSIELVLKFLFMNLPGSLLLGVMKILQESWITWDRSFRVAPQVGAGVGVEDHISRRIPENHTLSKFRFLGCKIEADAPCGLWISPLLSPFPSAVE